MLRFALSRLGASLDGSLLSSITRCTNASAWNVRSFGKGTEASSPDTGAEAAAGKSNSKSTAPSSPDTAAGTAAVKEPKTRKNKKLPVKRYPSAYAMYMKHNFAEVKADLPQGTPSTEIMRAVGRKWSSLNDSAKEMYVFESNRIKEEVMKERASTSAEQFNRGEKRSASIYSNFVKANYLSVRDTLPAGANLAEVSRACRDRWASLSFEQKEEYRK